MNWKEISTNWAAFAPHIQEKWPQLTEANLDKIDGSRERLVMALAASDAFDESTAETEVAQFLEGAMPADVYTSPTHDNKSISDSEAYIAPGEDVYSDDAAFGDDTTAERGE